MKGGHKPKALRDYFQDEKRRNPLARKPVDDKRTPRIFDKQRVAFIPDYLGRLQNVENWRANFNFLLVKIGRLFEEELGKDDQYNQECAAAMVNLGIILYRMKKLDWIKYGGRKKYIEWAKDYSKNDEVKKNAEDLLKEIGN